VLISGKTALGTGHVTRSYLNWNLRRHGVSIERIRRDRVLHEALTARADSARDGRHAACADGRGQRLSSGMAGRCWENPDMAPVDVAGLIDALAARAHWPYGAVAGVMNEAPEVLPDLLHAGVARLSRSSTAIDAVIGLVDADVLRAEASHGIAVLAAGADPRHSQAASLIAYVSLQDPHRLAGDLDLLWDLGVNHGAYYESWPWRAATDPALQEHLVRLMGSADAAAARRARACLLQTRDPGLLRRAAADAAPGPLPWVLDLRAVAWDFDGKRLIRLAPAATYHLRFPSGFLRPFRWAGASQPIPHPTWQLPADPGMPAAFGGLAAGSCPGCGGQLHRLLHLPVIPAGLGVSSCRALELATCLTCLGWAISTIFFRHGSDGHIIAAIGERDTNTGFVLRPGPLPAAQVSLTATPPRWDQQDWALSNNRENLNRIGGEPTWIQDPGYPQCPVCQRRMHFLAQLDSLDFADGSQWLWGSGGIAYILWCDPCRMSATLWQCT